MKGLVNLIVSFLAIATVNLFSMEADREGAMSNEYAQEMAREAENRRQADENRRREEMNQRLTQARLRAHRERMEQARQDLMERQAAEQQDAQVHRHRVGRRLNF